MIWQFLNFFLRLFVLRIFLFLASTIFTVSFYIFFIQWFGVGLLTIVLSNCSFSIDWLNVDLDYSSFSISFSLNWLWVIIICGIRSLCWLFFGGNLRRLLRCLLGIRIRLCLCLLLGIFRLLTFTCFFSLLSYNIRLFWFLILLGISFLLNLFPRFLRRLSFQLFEFFKQTWNITWIFVRAHI